MSNFCKGVPKGKLNLWYLLLSLSYAFTKFSDTSILLLKSFLLDFNLTSPTVSDQGQMPPSPFPLATLLDVSSQISIRKIEKHPNYGDITLPQKTCEKLTSMYMVKKIRRDKIYWITMLIYIHRTCIKIQFVFCDAVKTTYSITQTLTGLRQTFTIPYRKTFTQ